MTRISITRACGGSGANPEPTVIVWMGEVRAQTFKKTVMFALFVVRKNV
ncbi:hypothetical protein DB29_00181 [Shouchella clausii]|nr:hypothetical protein DB29_00181 [Shouchella clausii]